MDLKVLICLLSAILATARGISLSPHISDYEVLSYNTKQVHQQHRRAIRSPKDRLVELNFNAYGNDFHLHLWPDNSVLADNFVFVTSEGPQSRQVSDAVHFYKGELAGNPESFVHGSLKDGAFQGRILTKEDKYSVESAERYFENSTDFHSVIYKDQHVDIPNQASGTCGMLGEIHERMMAKLEEANNAMPGARVVDPHDTEKGTDRYKRQAELQTCGLHVITDHIYYDRFYKGDGSPEEKDQADVNARNEILRQMGEHIQAASQLFGSHSFNGFTDIEFAIEKISLYDFGDVGDANYTFDSDYIGVEKFLDITSDIARRDAKRDKKDYCLVYTFTNRDFANGVLGLAWIADSKSLAGGICGTQYNAGIVTTNNYGKELPPLVSHLTFAHELGHSFGSRHDPDSCAPGGEAGNYLMFAHASSGDLRNNNEFSSCSNRNISLVLGSLSGKPKGSCFKETGSITLCGNLVKEVGEECDCGPNNSECGDQCCADDCQLRNVTDVKCSPQQGICCSSTCGFKDSTKPCAEATICAEASFCNGSAAECPTPVVKMPNAGEDFIECDEKRKLCSEGTCSKSICEKTGRKPCQCTSKSERCNLCCTDKDDPKICTSYHVLTGVKVPLKVDVGTPCEDYMGYCDVFSECRLAQEDGPLANIIRGIFFSEEVQLWDAIKSWLSKYWWVVVLAFIILVGLMALLMFACNLMIPTDNPWKEEVHNERRNRVSLRNRRDRGSQYPTSGRSDEKITTAF